MMEGRQMMQDRDTESQGTEIRPKKKSKKTVWVILGCVVFILASGAACIYYAVTPPRGCQDYRVRMQQYVSEYSEEYEYSEVVTVEYPEVEGIGEEQQEKINRMMYDTAMDRTNYWHLKPGDYARNLQKEYSIFSSDAVCEVSYHSQYLLSLNYEERYAPVNPIYYVRLTKRGLSVDLLTGEQYGLSDIVRIDDEFIDFWAGKANSQYDGFFGEDEESRELLLEWFMKDGEWDQSYELAPYFYIKEDKDIVVGIAIDPKFVAGAQFPKEDAYEVCFSAQELEKFRTESEFWEKYELSEQAGEIVECEELWDNIWLSDLSGAEGYWDRIETLFQE